jgi:hypothetical protein
MFYAKERNNLVTIKTLSVVTIKLHANWCQVVGLD